MENKKKENKILHIIIMLLILIWGLGSIVFGVVFCINEDFICSLICIGQLFFICGSFFSTLHTLFLILFGVSGFVIMTSSILLINTLLAEKNVDQSTITGILIIIFLLICLLLLIIGTVMYKLRVNRLCTYRVSAKLKSKENQNINSSVTLPIFTYYYNGQYYDMQYNELVLEPITEDTSSMEILINPNNPNQFYQKILLSDILSPLAALISLSHCTFILIYILKSLQLI